jgi:hypothetical protein
VIAPEEDRLRMDNKVEGNGRARKRSSADDRHGGAVHELNAPDHTLPPEWWVRRFPLVRDVRDPRFWEAVFNHAIELEGLLRLHASAEQSTASEEAARVVKRVRENLGKPQALRALAGPRRRQQALEQIIEHCSSCIVGERASRREGRLAAAHHAFYQLVALLPAEVKTPTTRREMDERFVFLVESLAAGDDGEEVVRKALRALGVSPRHISNYLAFLKKRDQRAR